MNILITSIGSTTSIGVVKFIRALKRNIEITGTDINLSNRIAGSSLVDQFYKVPLNTDPAYLDKMLQIVRERKIQILIPIHDYEIEVLSREADQFKNAGCKIIVSSNETVKVVNNKYEFARRLSAANILVPSTFTINGWMKEEFSTDDLWILKPIQGVSSRGILRGSTDEIKLLIGDQKVSNDVHVIQEFIQGIEYTVDVFVKNKKAYCVVPRVRDEIREGICYKSHTVSNEKFIEAVNNIVSIYDFYGPINIQFIADDKGGLYCIECNPRFGGSSVNTLYAGINLFKFILDDFENKPLEFNNDYRKVFMTRYWEEVVYEE